VPSTVISTFFIVHSFHNSVCAAWSPLNVT